jgi:hypothetical protein
METYEEKYNLYQSISKHNNSLLEYKNELLKYKNLQNEIKKNIIAIPTILEKADVNINNIKDYIEQTLIINNVKNKLEETRNILQEMNISSHKIENEYKDTLQIMNININTVLDIDFINKVKKMIDSVSDKLILFRKQIEISKNLSIIKQLYNLNV